MELLEVSLSAEPHIRQAVRLCWWNAVCSIARPALPERPQERLLRLPAATLAYARELVHAGLLPLLLPRAHPFHLALHVHQRRERKPASSSVHGRHARVSLQRALELPHGSQGAALPPQRRGRLPPPPALGARSAGRPSAKLTSVVGTTVRSISRAKSSVSQPRLEPPTIGSIVGRRTAYTVRRGK